MATIEPYTAADGSKRYRVRLRVDGKTTSERGFVTVRDAKPYAAEVEVSKLSGRYVAPSAGRITVGDLAARWLADSVRIKSTTRAARESAWSTSGGAELVARRRRGCSSEVRSGRGSPAWSQTAWVPPLPNQHCSSSEIRLRRLWRTEP